MSGRLGWILGGDLWTNQRPAILLALSLEHFSKLESQIESVAEASSGGGLFDFLDGRKKRQASDYDYYSQWDLDETGNKNAGFGECALLRGEV